jgi:hypothetical protein
MEQGAPGASWPISRVRVGNAEVREELGFKRFHSLGFGVGLMVVPDQMENTVD